MMCPEQTPVTYSICKSATEVSDLELKRLACPMQGPSSKGWIHNWLLSFHLFISIAGLELICFNSGAVVGMTWSTLLHRKRFFLSMDINTPMLLYLACGMQMAVGVPKLIRKGTEAWSRERGQRGAEADNRGLVQNSAWELSYLPLAGGTGASCAKSGANAAFLLLFGFLPPQDGSQHRDYLCIFKHGTIYFLKSLMYS